MWKRSAFLLSAAALVGFAMPSGANAQAVIYVSGGGSFPTGDFGDFAKTGWMAAAGVLFDVGAEGVGVGVEGFYGQNNHETEGDKTNPYGAMAIIDYVFDTGSNAVPYVFGGAGLLVHRYSSDVFDTESDSQFGYQFGGGIGFGVSENVTAYVEGRYMGSSDTKFIGALAGLAFSVGN